MVVSRRRYGVTIHRSEVRIVGVVRGRSAWTWRGEITDGDTAGALKNALLQMPRPSIGRPLVRVGVGASAAQLRTISGLAAEVESTRRTAAVASNPERFFLRWTGATTVSPVFQTPGGEYVAAAFDGAVINALRAALAGAPVRIEGMINVASAVPWGVGVNAKDNSMLWSSIDGELRLRLSAGTVTAAHPVVGALVDSIDGNPPSTSTSGGNTDWTEAFSVATCNLEELPYLPGGALRGTSNAGARATRLGVSLAMAAAMVAWLFAPAMLAMRSAERAEARMVALTRTRSHAARLAADARDLEQAARHVDQFRAGRLSMTYLLGAISSALPESTAVTSLRIDSLGGTAILLAPRVLPALPKLLSLQPLDGMQATGPITREAFSGRELERLSIRFRLRRLGTGSMRPSKRYGGALN